MRRNIVLLILLFSITKIIFGQSESYIVEKASFSLDKFDEFSPVFFGNGIVFVTNRQSYGLSNYSSEQDRGPLKIYYIENTEKSKWGKAKLFSDELKTKFNDGPVTFNSTRDTVYFSRNLEVEGKLAELSTARNKLGIFYAVLVNYKWSKIRDLKINNEWYNVTSPSLSPNGKRLYFSSDKPGGFGGPDLYYCDWKKDHWDNPVNLGPVINTPGSETSPFANAEGALFFSSDGHAGLGGKDIFYSKPSGSSWLPPVGLDPPINSQFDDFALIADPMMNEGYFSSKRGNSFDIYHFKTNFHQLFYCQDQRTDKYCFKFNDEAKIPINEELLQYVWDFGDGTQTKGLNVEHCFPGPGNYSVRLNVVDKKTGRIFFSKRSYNLELKNIEQAIIKSTNSALVGESVSFNGLSSNFPGSQILKYSWSFVDGERTTGDIVNHTFKKKGDYNIKLGLILKNEKTGVIFESCASKLIRVFSDAREKSAFDSQKISPAPVTSIFDYDHAFIGNMYSAEAGFNQDAVFIVEILASKTKLNLNSPVFNAVPKMYSVKEIRLPSDNLFHYVIDEEMTLMSTYFSFNEMVDRGFKETRIRTFVPEDPATKELNNLKKVFGVSADMFFNYNDFNLTSEGTQVLDQIIGFMTKYPLIKLEIATYTDNIGVAATNLLLSQRRAESIVNYLIKNGVSSLRLKPVGMGSAKPISPNLYEADRKLNRRVEFTIIK